MLFIWSQRKNVDSKSAASLLRSFFPKNSEDNLEKRVKCLRGTSVEKCSILDHRHSTCAVCNVYEFILTCTLVAGTFYFDKLQLISGGSECSSGTDPSLLLCTFSFPELG